MSTDISGENAWKTSVSWTLANSRSSVVSDCVLALIHALRRTAVTRCSAVYLWTATSGCINELMTVQGDHDRMSSVSRMKEGGSEASPLPPLAPRFVSFVRVVPSLYGG